MVLWECCNRILYILYRVFKIRGTQLIYLLFWKTINIFLKLNIYLIYFVCISYKVSFSIHQCKVSYWKTVWEYNRYFSEIDIICLLWNSGIRSILYSNLGKRKSILTVCNINLASFIYKKDNGSFEHVTYRAFFNLLIIYIEKLPTEYAQHVIKCTRIDWGIQISNKARCGVL